MHYPLRVMEVPLKGKLRCRRVDIGLFLDGSLQHGFGEKQPGAVPAFFARQSISETGDVPGCRESPFFKGLAGSPLRSTIFRLDKT